MPLDAAWTSDREAICSAPPATCWRIGVGLSACRRRGAAIKDSRHQTKSAPKARQRHSYLRVQLQPLINNTDVT